MVKGSNGVNLKKLAISVQQINNPKRLKLITRSFQKLKLTTFLWLSILLLVPVTITQAKMEPRFQMGYVLSRGLVFDDDGFKIWSEYGEDGKIIQDVGHAKGNLSNGQIMTGDDYRFIVKYYNDYLTEHQNDSARGAYVMSAEDYKQTTFVTKGTGQLVYKPNLSPVIKSVLVRSNDQLLLPSSELVLVQARMDLNESAALDANTQSVLLDNKGRIAYKSTNNIGLKVDFYEGYSDGNRYINVNPKTKIYGPMRYVPIETPAYITGHGVTNKEGFFDSVFFVAPCPGFAYEALSPNFVTLNYASFNPKKTGGPNTYTLMYPGYQYCANYSARAPGMSLNGLMAQVAAIGIEASMAIPIYKSKYYIDASVISGSGYLLDEYGAPLEISDKTTYDYKVPDLTPIAQTAYDFDGDERPETAILGNMVTITDVLGATHEVFKPIKEDETAELQGIYLSSGHHNPNSSNPVLNQPDFVRLADIAPDYQNQGLLKTITSEDFQDTDIYVFRESNGMLITQRKGLKKSEVTYHDVSGLDEDKNKMFYQMLIRGPISSGSDIAVSQLDARRFESFQSKMKMNEALYQRASDHLRPQEGIRIIAINRKTGYIGSVQTTFASQHGSGNISFPIPELQMAPPNLKIFAEREYQVEAGTTQGEQKKYLIGSEGAALTSDKVIKITTEWLDQDGSPLPKGLEEYGYTGRLAKILSSQVVGESNQLAHFSITPGRHTEFVRLQGSNFSEHFYLQVAAEPISGNPDFGGTGAAESGPLQYRPAHYVPIKAAILDETQSWLQYRAWRRLQREGQISGAEPAPEPVYHWFYRSEMQFSMYHFEMDSILRGRQNGQTIDIYPNQHPEISKSDDFVQLLYNLVEQQLEPLPFISYGEERDLVFALGEEEIKVTLDGNHQIKFENLAHLAKLTPEDFLSIRLYTNNDSSNLLWQYGFKRSLIIRPEEDQAKTHHVKVDIPNNWTCDSPINFKFNIDRKARITLKMGDKKLADNQPYSKGEHSIPINELELGRSEYRLTAIDDDGIKEEVKGTYDNLLSTTNNLPIGHAFEEGIDLFDGKLTYAKTDINIPDRGPSLNFSRSFSSTNLESGVMGPGWGHNYQTSLNEIGCDLVSVDNGVGGALFKKAGDGFIAAKGYHSSLKKTADGYDFFSKDGTQYHFSKNPREVGFIDSASLQPGRKYLLSYIQDTNQNRLTLSYDNTIDAQYVEPILTKVTDSSGRNLIFDYQFITPVYGDPSEDPSERSHEIKHPVLTAIHGPETLIQLSYNEQGQLVEVNTNGITESYSYLPLDNGFEPKQSMKKALMLSRTNGIGATTSYEYEEGRMGMDFSGKAVEIDHVYYNTVHHPETADTQISDGDRLSRRSNDDLFTTKVMNPRGISGDYILNYYGAANQIQRPNGLVKFHWDMEQILITSRTDERGIQTAMEYDDFGNLLSEKVGSLPAIKRTYRQENNILNLLDSETDRNGNTTNFSYDDAGNVLTIKYPDASTSTYDYQDNGDRKSATDPNGNTTQYGYDTFGNVASISAPDAGTRNFSYDSRSLKTSESDGNGHVTRFKYDSRGFLTTKNLPLGTIAYHYDNVGDLLSQIDANGNETTWTYNKEQKVSAQKRPLGEKTLSYDTAGNLVTETDWMGNITRYGYNAVHHRTSQVKPLGLTSTISNDAVGNVLRIELPNGRFSAFTYDDLSRPLTTTDPSGVVTRILDGNGNKLSETDQLGRTTSFVYDNRNRIKTITQPEGVIIEKVLYDKNSNLLEEKDARGTSTSHTYDKANRLLSSTKAGSTTTSRYDNAGNLLSDTDAEGRVTDYTYDNNNRRTDLTKSNYYERYRYDLNGNLLTQTTPANTTTLTYDALNRQTSKSDNLGAISTTTYDFNGNTTATTDANGHENTFVFDALNHLTQQHLSGDRVTTLTPDMFGNITQKTDPNGNSFTFSYDETNRLINEVHPNGSLTYTYDKVGNKRSLKDKRGQTTTYTYDGLNRLTKTVDPMGFSLTQTYDLNGNVSQQTDKRGTLSTTTYDLLDRPTIIKKAGITLSDNSYDKVGNLTAQKDANGNVTHFEYNHLDLVTSTQSPLSATTISTYNPAGQLISSQDPEGRITTRTPDPRDRTLSQNFQGLISQFQYDLNGNRTQSTQPMGNSLSYQYDAANRLTEVISPTGSTTYSYDNNGNRLTQTDAMGYTTSFEYDANNLLIQQKNADNATTQMKYDANGNRTQTLLPNGNGWTATYDNNNRQTQVSYSGANPSDAVVFTKLYDANNNLTQVTQTDLGPTQYSYDAFDRVTGKTDNYGNNIHYGYDNNGNRTQLSSRAGTTQYSFDALNRLTLAISNTGPTQYSYDKTGLIQSIQYPNSTHANYEYDDKKRILGITNQGANGLLSSYAYSLDLNGNRIQQTEINGGSTEITIYGYDKEDRLTFVDYPDKKISYSYDKNFNRISEVETTDAGAVTIKNLTQQYNNRNQLLKIEDSVSPALNNVDYSYDPNGNQIQKIKNAETTHFSYDVRDRLKQITTGGSSKGQFLYDYQGLRIEKQGERGTERYSYDNQSVLLQTDESNNLKASFNYGPFQLLSLTETSKPTEYYLFDALGSPVNIAQQDGSLTARYQYDAWGHLRKDESTSWNRFGFTGHENDKETGLIYAKARYLDPDTGRFLNQDAFDGFTDRPPSLHKYIYAYGNPTVYCDPDGNESVSTMLSRAEDNADGPWGAFGYRFLSNIYHAGTLGFASIHDPAKDAYDSGKITGKQYAAAGTAALIAPAVVIGTGGTAGGAIATASTTLGRIGLTSTVGATYSGGLDAYTQGALIATDVQEKYNLNQTAIATATGAILAPVAVEGSLAATRTVESILASRSASNTKVIVENPSGYSSLQATADAEAGLSYNHSVKSTEKPNFYVRPNGDVIPSTGYRAVGGEANIAEAEAGIIGSRDPTYISFDDITQMTPKEAGSYLQLPREPTHSVSFDTLQIIDDIRIPNGRWNTTNTPEPITSTFPKWGEGGGTQAITEKPILVKPPRKLKDPEGL